MAGKKARLLRVQLNPELLRWAIERAGYSLENLKNKFPKIVAWERGEVQPTLKQLERLAKTLRVPLGFLFLDHPPTELLPIPDFRTAGWVKHSRPTSELLDTIYICQQAQEWYRDYLVSTGEKPLPFVASATIDDDPYEVAAEIRERLGFNIGQRRALPTWTQALSGFIEQVENIGIVVMVNGVVGNNTHRPLDPSEFRGFALVDTWAPLVFVNGADTISAKTFTLAHELSHIWLGKSGVTDSELFRLPDDPVERWCNQVAAEILVPQESLEQYYNPHDDIHVEMNRLARVFKVSTLVVLRRLFDAGHLDWNTYKETYNRERDRLLSYERKQAKGGGDFYATLRRRVSPRLAQALAASVYEGHTLFRDALRMLGISKIETFKRFVQNLRRP